jgi:hypothetical protein
VATELVPLLGDRGRVDAMAAAAASVGHRDGTDRMVASSTRHSAGVPATRPAARNVE